MAEEPDRWTGPGREKASGREPKAADEVTIFDYVMLDFIDEPLAPRKKNRQGIVTEPWRHY